jgi:YhcH/YjgK/YiaL family protein
MVVDSLSNAGIYRTLGLRIAAALGYLERTDFWRVTPGRHDLDGDRLFALVQDYTTRPEREGRWECHRRYIDLQFVVSGVERIGYAPVASLQAGPYDADRDIAWLDGTGSFVRLPAGHMMLLWPDDAHMPGIAEADPSPVRKVVVKIARD